MAGKQVAKETIKTTKIQQKDRKRKDCSKEFLASIIKKFKMLQKYHIVAAQYRTVKKLFLKSFFTLTVVYASTLYNYLQHTSFSLAGQE